MPIDPCLRREGVAAAPRLVAQLRERHPGASKGEIEDYLITAYCPVVNMRSDVSDGVKRADVAKFRMAVQRYLYP